MPHNHSIARFLPAGLAIQAVCKSFSKVPKEERGSIFRGCAEMVRCWCYRVFCMRSTLSFLAETFWCVPRLPCDTCLLLQRRAVFPQNCACRPNGYSRSSSCSPCRPSVVVAPLRRSLYRHLSLRLTTMTRSPGISHLSLSLAGYQRCK